MTAKPLPCDFPPAKRGTLSSIRYRLASIEISQLIADWEYGPPVEVVSSVEDLPVKAPEDAVGLYYRKKVYIVAAQPNKNIAKTLAHEALAHAGTRTALGGVGWRRFMLALRSAAMKGSDVLLRGMRTRVITSYVDGSGKRYLSPTQEGNEILAALAEQSFDRRTGRILIHDPLRKQAEALAAQAVRQHLGIHVDVTGDQAEGMLIASEHTVRYGSPLWGAEFRARRTYYELIAAFSTVLAVCGWLFI